MLQVELTPTCKGASIKDVPKRGVRGRHNGDIWGHAGVKVKRDDGTSHLNINNNKLQSI